MRCAISGCLLAGLAAVMLAALVALGIVSELKSMISVSYMPRIVSPDGRLEVVHRVADGGATTSFGSSVYVVPRGARPTGRDLVLAGDDYCYSRIRWRSNTELDIENVGRDFWRYRNFWSSPVVDGGKRVVTIRMSNWAGRLSNVNPPEPASAKRKRQQAEKHGEVWFR